MTTLRRGRSSNGTQEGYEAATSTDGWTQISSIEAGDSEFQVKVKFSEAYPDWSANFSTVSHAAGLADAKTFNEGWSDGMAVVDWFTGPFKVTDIDQSAKLVTLEKNPNWWGDEPKLDKVTFKALETAAMAQAFANNELDVVDMIIDADTYQLVQKRSDAKLYMSTSVQWRHFTFNSRAGALVTRRCDKPSRRASTPLILRRLTLLVCRPPRWICTLVTTSSCQTRKAMKIMLLLLI